MSTAPKFFHVYDQDGAPIEQAATRQPWNASQKPSGRRVYAPWDGPVTEPSICPVCLRSLRGEPEPEAPRLVPAGVVKALSESEPVWRGRHLRAVPAPVTYAEAPLPAEHAGRPITWSRWITSPVISHYDQSCEWCGDKGPGEMAGGRQGSPMSRTDLPCAGTSPTAASRAS